MDCYSCKSLSGEARISPGPPVYEGQFWVVDHAYPSSLSGWLVIVLRRHASALHELTHDEFEEMAQLQEKAARALREVLGCEKEYIACYGEAEHFNHVHVHVVPRAADMPREFVGAGSFQLLKPDRDDAVSPSRVVELCEQLQVYFA